jgi:hypothetical protein
MSLYSQVLRRSKHHRNRWRLLQHSLWRQSLIPRRRLARLRHQHRHRQHLRHQLRRSRNLCHQRLHRLSLHRRPHPHNLRQKCLLSLNLHNLSLSPYLFTTRACPQRLAHASPYCLSRRLAYDGVNSSVSPAYYMVSSVSAVNLKAAGVSAPDT